MGVTIYNISTTTEPPPYKDSSLSGGGGGGGGLNAFFELVPNFALESTVINVQEIFSSHGSILTNAMYHHGQHSNQITHYD